MISISYATLLPYRPCCSNTPTRYSVDEEYGTASSQSMPRKRRRASLGNPAPCVNSMSVCRWRAAVPSSAEGDLAELGGLLIFLRKWGGPRLFADGPPNHTMTQNCRMTQNTDPRSRSRHQTHAFASSADSSLSAPNPKLLRHSVIASSAAGLYSEPLERDDAKSRILNQCLETLLNGSED